MKRPRITQYVPSLLLAGMIILAGVFLQSGVADALTPPGTNINNTASATYADANANSYSATSNTVTTTVNAVYTVSVTTPADQAVPSNTTAYYAYTVTNTGNASNTFALSGASGAGGNTWTVTLYADDGAGGGTANDGVHQAGETTVTASTGALAASATYKFFMAVTVTANTAKDQTDDSQLTVTGSGDPGAGDDTSDTVTTTAQAPSLSITKAVRNVTTAGAFNTTATADPGDTLEYRLTVTNTASANTLTATSIVLTDNDNANTTYVAGSVWIGSDGSTYNGAGNANKTDANTGDAACGTEACGCATVSSGNVSAYLGNTATESAGGTLASGSTVYVYFRVTVD